MGLRLGARGKFVVKGVRLGLDKEIGSSGHTFWGANLLLEGCRYNAQRKYRRWVVLCVRPIDGIFVSGSRCLPYHNKF